MEGDNSQSGEAWARQQVQRSKAIIFPPEWAENDRTVSGGFVVDAIQNMTYADGADGLRIENAIVSTHVYRRFLTCPSEVSFHKCVFKQHFELPFAIFPRRLRFIGCTFADNFNIHNSTFTELAFYTSKDATPNKFLANAIFLGVTTAGTFLVTHCEFLNPQSIASFNTAKSTGNMSLEGSLFAGPTDLAGLTVESQLNCTDTKFLNEAVPVKFNGAKLLNGAILDNSRFRGGADFIALRVLHRLQCVNAIFSNNTQEVSFSTATVDGPAILEGCTFNGPVDFTSAIVKHDLYCKGTRFLNEQLGAAFTAIKVSGSAFFDDCEFSGPFKIPVAHIAGTGSFNRAKFKKLANLQALTVRGSVTFRKTEFGGSIDLSGAEIDGQLILADDTLASRDGGLVLNSAKVKRGVFLENSHLEGFLNCAGANIGGQFAVSQTRFLHQTASTSFSSARVEGDVVIHSCQFSGLSDFTSIVTTGQFRCTSCDFTNDTQLSDFSGIHAEGSAVFWGCTFNGPVHMRNSKFLQNLSIATAQFNKDIDLSNAIVGGTLYVFDIPKEQLAVLEPSLHQTKLPTSASFHNFRFAESDLHKNHGWKRWLGLSLPPKYAPDPFITLEHSFRKMGRIELADNVYYSMKEQEAQHLWETGSFGKWLVNQALRFLVGYGVRGWRLWFWAIPLPLGFSFACQYVHSTIGPIRSMFYAIDIFLPVDLHQPKICDIAEPITFLLELWGWIIIPLALAQLSGSLKRKEPAAWG